MMTPVSARNKLFKKVEDDSNWYPGYVDTQEELLVRYITSLETELATCQKRESERAWGDTRWGI